MLVTAGSDPGFISNPDLNRLGKFYSYPCPNPGRFQAPVLVVELYFGNSQEFLKLQNLFSSRENFQKVFRTITKTIFSALGSEFF